MLPSSVTSIGKSAFDGCKSLKSITLQSSVTSIGRGVFRDCSSLKSIIIPENSVEKLKMILPIDLWDIIILKKTVNIEESDSSDLP